MAVSPLTLKAELKIVHLYTLGGHNIPNDIIRRRYQRGLLNFFELYSPLSDYWIVYNNSQSPTQEIAEKAINSSAIIYQPHIWQQINQKHYES
jgi:predicted ABC-type ATPase